MWSLIRLCEKQPIFHLNFLWKFVDTVLKTFADPFIDALSAAFIISSRVITEPSIVLFKCSTFLIRYFHNYINIFSRSVVGGCGRLVFRLFKMTYTAFTLSKLNKNDLTCITLDMKSNQNSILFNQNNKISKQRKYYNKLEADFKVSK